MQFCCAIQKAWFNEWNSAAFTHSQQGNESWPIPQALNNRAAELGITPTACSAA